MRILIVGATGYIGGTVAMRLRAAGHTVLGTARNEGDATRLRALGLESAVVTLDDSAGLTALAKKADAVINAASSDQRSAVEALLRGTKRLIHTSGSSVVSTDARGELVPAIYDETTARTPVPEKVARQAIDDLVRNGGQTAVICPGIAYGRGTGLKTETIHLPLIMNDARKHGSVRYIGQGKNIWSNVHVEDLADLYAMALERAEPGAFLFAENGEASMRELSEAIGRRLELPTTSMTFDEGAEAWGHELARFGMGSNSRIRGVRARALGWAPRRPSLFESIATRA